jgi:hypothetical protein
MTVYLQVDVALQSTLQTAREEGSLAIFPGTRSLLEDQILQGPVEGIQEIKIGARVAKMRSSSTSSLLHSSSMVSREAEGNRWTPQLV